MRRSKTLAINALLATLIVIFTFIPLIPGIGVGLAVLVLLPVIIAGQIDNWKSALFAGTFFGILSLISSFIMPTSMAPLFHNPIVSILPRMCIGLVAHLVYTAINRIMTKRKCKLGITHTVASTLSAMCAVLTNTGLVLAMIWAFYHGKTVGETAITAEFMMGLVSLNFVIEIVVATLLTPPIAFAVRKTLGRSRIYIAPESTEISSVTDDADTTSKTNNAVDINANGMDKATHGDNITVDNVDIPQGDSQISSQGSDK